MLVRDFMTYNPEFVYSVSTILEAAKKMKEVDAGFLPVVNKKTAEIIGTITDRDIIINAIAEEKDIHFPVEYAMEKRVYTCFEDDSIETAAKLMGDRQIRRIMVVDDDKKLLGVISLGDIAANDSNKKLKSDAITSISKP